MTRLSFLVVDDDPLMLAMLEPRLKALQIPGGSGVRGFLRPDHALEHLAKAGEPPVVLLSDFNLKAGMTGLDLLRRVSVSHPNVIRVLMSGYSRDQIGLAPDAPIDGFVEKELHAEDIVREIAAIVDRALRGLRGEPGAVVTTTERPRPAAPAAERPVSSATPAHHAATLPESQLFLSFVTSTQDFAIIALDPAGIVRSWNPGAQRIKGWSAKEVIGRHFGAFYPPTDVAAHKPAYVLQRASEDGRYEDEGWRIRKDGSMFWANAVVTAVRDAEGKLVGFVKITRDLTARRHAEEAMRQSEERYRLFISSVKDYAMFILDTSGHIMTWNEGAQRLKGYRPEEIVGKHFSVFYTQPDRDRQHPAEELSLALRDGRYQEEGWRLRKDGSAFWAHVTITALFDADRRHVGFAKVTRDLTERRNAEERLRQRADSYAELNRELDAFSHSVAHDLRAPVRAMEGIIEHVLEDAKDRLNAEEVASLRAVVASSRNMSALIQDLLDLSKTAREEPRREDVDLSRLVERILDEKRMLHPDRVVRATIQPGLHARADGRLLRVALANLLDNAIKFARGNEAVITFGRDASQPQPTYFVRDEGVGFSTEDAARLFHPFVRLHAATGVPGTGIGLTIVDRIIRRHGGAVWAESEAGKGTTFRFTLEAPANGERTTPRAKSS